MAHTTLRPFRRPFHTIVRATGGEGLCARSILVTFPFHNAYGRYDWHLDPFPGRAADPVLSLAAPPSPETPQAVLNGCCSAFHIRPVCPLRCQAPDDCLPRRHMLALQVPPPPRHGGQHRRLGVQSALLQG